MDGYAGVILRVDLNLGRIWTEPIKEAWTRDLIGGSDGGSGGDGRGGWIR